MSRWVTLVLLGVLGALGTSHVADAGCGCAKPPPPRAVVRPFVAWPTETITLFNDNLVNGVTYNVRFRSSMAHAVVWTKGIADNTHKDLADGQVRPRLTVAVPTALPPGPCRITIWGKSLREFSINDDQFTVTAPPIALHQFDQQIVQDGYQAGVGRDGTVYLAFDLSQVTDATTFYGTAIGLPVTYSAGNVAMYNDQGFLMQTLDSPGAVWSITHGDSTMSDVLGYWRHEFATYKQQHQQLHDFALDQDPNWHMDGTYHVNHDKIVVAINATTNGVSHLARGMTPPFKLVVMSAASSTGIPGLEPELPSSSGGGGADDTSGDDGSLSELPGATTILSK